MQSPEINAKVDNDEELGAGDQGLMFGYATNETKNYLPIPYDLATMIIKQYENIFADLDKDFKYDSKSQVSFDYTNKRIVNINLSVQHSEEISLDDLRLIMKELILDTVNDFQNNVINKEQYPNPIIDDETDIVINNGGTFIMGGANADAGVTGRKIIADTYGGLGRHGGGAFSGKDYTKVDRSAAYYARYVARKIVEEGFADIAEIQVAYIIGQAAPVEIFVETFDTGDSVVAQK
jgi:S-adenosylmethionine synthetase